MWEKIFSKCDALTPREVSNLFWSLGKLDADVGMAVGGAEGQGEYQGEGGYGSHGSLPAVLPKLLDKLGSSLPRMSPFDVESTMVGLGLLKVRTTVVFAI